MYVPSLFAEQRVDVLREFISKHAFATLVTGGDVMTASHLPMLLLPPCEGDADRFGTLQTHLARQNEQCAALAAGQPVLAVFQGPHA